MDTSLGKQSAPVGLGSIRWLERQALGWERVSGTVLRVGWGASEGPKKDVRKGATGLPTSGEPSWEGSSWRPGTTVPDHSAPLRRPARVDSSQGTGRYRLHFAQRT